MKEIKQSSFLPLSTKEAEEDDNDDVEIQLKDLNQAHAAIEVGPDLAVHRVYTNVCHSEFLTVYIRAFRMLGEEKLKAKMLVFANILLSVVLLALPILFGKIIDRLGHIAAERDTADTSSDNGNWFYSLLPLIITWSGFGIFGVVSGMLIGYKADQLAHRKRHDILLAFYDHALRSMPLTSTHDSVQDSGKIRKIMDEGINALFWTWLNLLRSDLVSLFLFLFLLPVAFCINIYMSISLLILCSAFTTAVLYVHQNAYGLQKQAEKYYKYEGSTQFLSY